eukprot:SAG11_NODE_1413_length_4981_cov_2.208726_4_plen_176_part_00
MILTRYGAELAAAARQSLVVSTCGGGAQLGQTAESFVLPCHLAAHPSSGSCGDTMASEGSAPRSRARRAPVKVCTTTPVSQVAAHLNYRAAQLHRRRTFADPNAPTGYFINSTEPLRWRSGVEFVFSHVGVSWTESRCPVASINASGAGVNITVAQPCFSNLLLARKIDQSCPSD